MCVIIVARHKLPPPRWLEEAERSNGDGGGVAWLHSGMVHWKKGISAKEIAALDITPPAIYHFRIATVGEKSKGLCHPFPISKKASTHFQGQAKKVLFHNGHWSDWKQFWMIAATRETNGAPTPKGEWSDSRTMAWCARLAGDRILKMISGQRIATMDSDGEIITYGEGWSNKDGFDLSNTTFLPYSTYGFESGRCWDEEDTHSSAASAALLRRGWVRDEDGGWKYGGEKEERAGFCGTKPYSADEAGSRGQDIKEINDVMGDM